jgi:hypothetical protein
LILLEWKNGTTRWLSINNSRASLASNRTPDTKTCKNINLTVHKKGFARNLETQSPKPFAIRAANCHLKNPNRQFFILAKRAKRGQTPFGSSFGF